MVLGGGGMTVGTFSCGMAQDFIHNYVVTSILVNMIFVIERT